MAVVFEIVKGNANNGKILGNGNNCHLDGDIWVTQISVCTCADCRIQKITLDP